MRYGCGAARRRCARAAGTGVASDPGHAGGKGLVKRIGRRRVHPCAQGRLGRREEKVSRYQLQKSSGHKCQRDSYLGISGYRISWTVDRYVKGSRLRYPTTFRRDTNEAGARRFCKKWGLDFPEEEK